MPPIVIRLICLKAALKIVNEELSFDMDNIMSTACHQTDFHLFRSYRATLIFDLSDFVMKQFSSLPAFFLILIFILNEKMHTSLIF